MEKLQNIANGGLKIFKLNHLQHPMVQIEPLSISPDSN
jgi:hypothetical protein